jgi:predicted PurR-regulated permease PerM
MNAICISLKYSLIIIKFNLSFILEYLLIALTFWIAGLYLIPNILVAHAELIKRINEIENEELDEIQSDF